MHEVGRNADFFDPKSARLLKAGSCIVSDSVHLHSNGRDTKSHLEIGFKFDAEGLQADLQARGVRPRQRRRHRHPRRWKPNQQLHAYTVLQQNTKIISFEPHLHAPGARMCLEAIWGYNIQTLNCVGYDHNWVRGYDYTDDSAPLLPKGTILHIIGYMDNSPSNKNVPDPRNWQGSGNRSVANMFIDLGKRVALTDEQFQEEMAKRREHLQLTKNDNVIGCPLCNVIPPRRATQNAAASDQQQSGATHCGRGICAIRRDWSRSRRLCAVRPLGAQSLSYTKGQNISPAYEGLGAGRRRHRSTSCSAT